MRRSPIRIQADPMANRVALEWFYKAFLVGLDLNNAKACSRELLAAQQVCPLLDHAIHAWKSIKFYYGSTDTVDVNVEGEPTLETNEN